MTEISVSLTRKRLTTPRAAAIAGILFALLYGIGLVLIRISIPADPAADITWLETNARTVSLALNLVPFAGIAFLWFIGSKTWRTACLRPCSWAAACCFWP